ncbi:MULTISPECIES: DUF4360 domain-containing protein [Actinomadura]|uniref:DUF4360 domain-containing protein n=1 Tax=Actinomadura litoris TaxID=2678616 RepID=A0A7K1KVV3_9ACTN|nr:MULTISPECIES: DUF4360 domain-containing protein [Actinomadura]MBT2211168.1 DUF4360 domain-containing protein [Actinomadura sp. NEAU-AAG7]MUN36086.1 DUF4360 domain-containing protein [Actinomadura litoris]
MRKGIVVSAVAVAATAAAVTPAVAAPRPANGPSGVTIEVAMLNGSGCPVGTTAVALSEDRNAFTITYSDYLAQAGGSANPVDGRRNCLISLRVHVPQGFTYAISSVDYRGFAHLQGGAGATLAAGYYFQGHPRTERVAHDLWGAFDNNWQFTDQSPLDQLVWQPCGEARNLNINSELRADVGSSAPDKVSFIAMDSTDGSIKSTYHVAWKRC